MIQNIFNRKDKKTGINFYQIPKDDENKPHFSAPKKDSIHQADILFLPTDKFGYKYLLVITDIKTRLTDAEPLKNKTANTINKAFNKIYDRNILDEPIQILVDDGGEFKGINKEELNIRALVPGKYLGVVDAKIKLISQALFYLMDQDELKNNKTSKAWIKNINEVIYLLNKRTKEKYESPDEDYEIKFAKNEELLKVGDKVYKALLVPEDALGNKLSGKKFRATDARFSRQISTISSVLEKPGSPILYLLDNKNNITYTRNKLLKVKK